jgi:hypothetical protein
MSKKSPSPPPAPDPVATAQAQGQINADTARLQGRMNRLDQVTPYGNVTYDDIGNDRARVTTTLSPAQQRQLELTNQAQELYGSAAVSQLGQVKDALSRPFQYQGPDVVTTLADRGGGLFYNLPSTYENDLRRSVTDRTGQVQQGVQDRNGQLQQSVTDRTGQLQQGVQDRNAELQRGVTDRTGQLQQGVQDRTGGLQFSVQDRTGDVQRGVMDRTGELQRSVQDRTGDVAQRADFTGVGDANQARSDVQAALLARMNPQLEAQRAALEARLVNQGITPGSQAWETGMRDYAQQANDARYGAILNAGQEQSRIFDLGFGQTNLRNQAVAQNMANDLQRGQFASNATAQLMSNDLQRGQFANDATNQIMVNDLQRGQFANNAMSQAAQMDLGRAGFQNQAAGQASGMELANAAFRNQAAGQATQADLARAQFGNQATGQASALDLANAAFRNQAAGQATQSDLARAGFGNQAVQQAYGMDMGAAQFANDTTQRAADLYTQRAQFNNQAQQQAYGMDIGRAQLNNAGVQQSLQQQLALRGQPINEAAALLSGQQIQYPQFQNVSQVQIQAPDYQGIVAQNYAAANSQYNAALQRQGANNAAIGQFGGQALGAAAMYFSDRRLKRNAERIGTGSHGLPIYRYEYLWGEPAIGYMADDVAAVAPHAVTVGPDGFAQVNYGALA